METVVRYNVRDEEDNSIEVFSSKKEALEYRIQLAHEYPKEKFSIYEQDTVYAGQDEDGCTTYDVVGEDELNE